MSNYFYKNLYEILEIEPTDDLSMIKSAFRKLARKYHPDLNGGNRVYEEKFKEIAEACEVLMNKDKKALYDSFKKYNFKKEEKVKSSSHNAKKAYDAYKSSQNFQKEKERTVTESKNTFSDVLNDILEGLFQEKSSNSYSSSLNFRENTKSAKRQAQNGTDIVSEVEISYFEAISGTNRTVNVLHTEICPNCNGKTFVNGYKCPLCQGSGETSIHKKINVKIPKNVKPNAKIRIAGEGNRGKFGGRNGDVYLVVKVKNDEKYTYDGLNVGFVVTIYPHEAVFGTELSVKTPQGNVLMKIPANTSQGQKFRLSSHGLKDDSGQIGDAIVTVKIDLPKELSDNELELYKKLAEISKHRMSEERV